jgi:hypothetical protein
VPDELVAVDRAEFPQDRVDVRPHGYRGEDKSARDLGCAQSVPKELENLPLAAGELGSSPLGGRYATASASVAKLRDDAP